MTRDEIVAMFERRNADWNRHDPAAVAAYHEEDAVGESPIQGRMLGRKSIMDGYATWLSAFPDVTIVTDDIVVEGTRVAQFFTMSGTQKGRLAGCRQQAGSSRSPACSSPPCRITAASRRTGVSTMSPTCWCSLER
jgi:hypothetical protein